MPLHFAIKMKRGTEVAFKMAWVASPVARHNTAGANTEVPDRRGKKGGHMKTSHFSRL